MSSFLMGYPHAPHHVQSPMSMGNGLDPKFPPVADDYHHYNGHYSMTASTGHMGGGGGVPTGGSGSGGGGGGGIGVGMSGHPHATHPAEMVNDYMAAAAHHHNPLPHTHHTHHSNSALSGHHHQNTGYSTNYATTPPTHHPHPHQSLGYYGHHAAAAAAAAVHHAPEYISAGVVHSEAGYGPPPSVNVPNGGGANAATNGYYGGYYGTTNGSVGSTHSQGHSPLSAQIMDLPLQCSSTEPPTNTSLGLQELGE